jgi:quercetin dioxygenase-like cupin family protein
MEHAEPVGTSKREPVILGPGEGEKVWFTDHLVTVKVRSRDASPFGLIEVRLPAGSRTPFHRHLEEDEAFYLLEGELTVVLEDRSIPVVPGGYVHLPRGAAHGLATDTGIRMLVLCDPGGFVEFAREAGVVAPRDELPPPAPPDVDRLVRLGKKFKIELLGPLPG